MSKLLRATHPISRPMFATQHPSCGMPLNIQAGARHPTIRPTVAPSQLDDAYVGWLQPFSTAALLHSSPSPQQPFSTAVSSLQPLRHSTLHNRSCTSLTYCFDHTPHHCSPSIHPCRGPRCWWLRMCCTAPFSVAYIADRARCHRRHSTQAARTRGTDR
jgi:hypothetical protein